MFAHFDNADRSYVRRVDAAVWVLWHWVMIWDKYQPVFVIEPHRILACSLTT
jgi:GTPase